MKSRLNLSFTSIFILLLTLNCFENIAQLPVKEIVPQSPNASQLGSFGNVPVGLFTGTIQQSIPIYELKTKNLSIPISLNYSSNGLIVDKVASWVGMDWTLDAGGVITLNVKGKKDDPVWGRADVPTNISETEILRNFLNTNYGNYDTEADIYSYNFLGNSGKFALNYTGTIASLIPYKKMIITQSSGNNMMHGSGFVIITEDGVKYLFNDIEDYQCQSCMPQITYNVAWFLTSIIHPAGDTITFYYTRNNASYYTGVSQQISKVILSQAGAICIDPPAGVPKGIGSTGFVAYLDSIKTSDGSSIIFLNSGNRSDFHQGKRLNEIIIKNNLNDVIKKVDFNYSYITGHPNYPSGAVDYQGLSCIECVNELNSRMFLDSIRFFDSYDLDIQKYSFEYYNLSYLPSRLSLAQDHWGFFNGIVNTDFIPAGYTSRPQFLGIGGNRNPNPEVSKNGLIAKITYPTGGYTMIEYEQNSNGTSIIGGCRVFRTKTYKSLVSEPIIKKYFYNDRNNLTTSYGHSEVPSIYYIEYDIYQPLNDIETVKCQFGDLISNSQTSLFYSNFSSVVYPIVTVSEGENFENGGTTHYYHQENNMVAENINTYGNSVYPTAYSNDGWYIGEKAGETYFKKNGSGQFIDIKKVVYNYNFDESRHSNNLWNLAITKRSSPTPPPVSWEILNDFDVALYKLYTRWKIPTSKITTEYDDFGNEFVTAINYNHSSITHDQLTDETISASSGQIVHKKYYYPLDYNTGVENMAVLSGKFMINKIVDSRTYRDNNLVSLEQYKYNDFGLITDYFKKNLKSSISDVPFNAAQPYTAEHKETFIYDNYLNLARTFTDYNISTSYIWGYRGTYPIIKGENIDNISLQNAINLSLPVGFNSLEELLTSNQGIEYLSSEFKKNLWKEFCLNMIGNIASNQSLTFYTYKPMVGVTSVTDSNTKSTYYEYDNFGRLRVVRDNEGNVIKAIEYNYKH